MVKGAFLIKFLTTATSATEIISAILTQPGYIVVHTPYIYS